MTSEHEENEIQKMKFKNEKMFILSDKAI